MKKKLLNYSIAFTAILFSACSSKTEGDKTTIPVATEEQSAKLVSSVMSAESQSSLTPDQVIAEFKQGNMRFQEGKLTARDFPAQVHNTAAGQFPKAVVLSCLDSRVPIETVLDQGVGDIFVGRVAGNFVNVDLLGSMEFACKVAGAKLVMVVGHESCGAVKGAIDDVKLGNITPMLANIKPAVELSKDFNGEKTSKNADFVKNVTEHNVEFAIKEIREQSPILKEMEAKGEIKIIGAYYTLATGALTFME